MVAGKILFERDIVAAVLMDRCVYNLRRLWCACMCHACVRVYIPELAWRTEQWGRVTGVGVKGV